MKEDVTKNRLKELLVNDQWVTSIQLDPFQNASSEFLESLKNLIHDLIRIGISVVDINSSRKGIKYDSLHMAGGIEQLGMTTIPHVTSRDSLTDAILSQILGAYLWSGVKNILVIRGDSREYENSQYDLPGVYQSDSPELIRRISLLRQERKLELSIGCAFSQTHTTCHDHIAEQKRLSEKIAFGADFVMTQPIFYSPNWKQEFDYLCESLVKPFLVGLWPFFDHTTLETLQSGKVTGVVLPSYTHEALAGKFDHANTYCLSMQAEWFKEMIQTMQVEGAAGVYIIAPFRRGYFSAFVQFLELLKIGGCAL